MTKDELEAHLDKLTLELGEHCDAVQILACTVEAEGTRAYFKGSGNWYARKAMCQEFVERDQARTLAQEMPRPE